MKKKKTLAGILDPQKLAEVERVLDYCGAGRPYLSESPQAKRISIRFLRNAVRFCPPISNALSGSYCERDVPIDHSRRSEGDQNSHNDAWDTSPEDAGQPPLLTGL